MIKNIIIRFTTNNDLDQLIWLYNQNYYGESKIQTDFNGLSDKFKSLNKNPDYKFISALDGEKLVGFCSVVVNHDIFEQQKPILILWNLRVHPKYRKNKIGKSLMRFTEDFAKSIGCYAIFLGCNKGNKVAKKFYKKQGYSKLLAFIKGI